MSEQLGKLRLGIVDLLGTILPGIVWLLLFLTLADMASVWTSNVERCGQPISPVGTAKSTAQYFNDAESNTLVAIFVVTAVLIGKIIKVISMRIAEILSHADEWLACKLFGERSGTTRFSDRLYPYPYKHDSTPYIDEIIHAVERLVGVKCLLLPSAQPIVACYRLIQAINDNLWTAVLIRESESRLAGSLFLASIFSLMLAVPNYFTCWTRGGLAWVTVSLFAIFIMAFTFRKARDREVSYMYIDTLLAISLFEKKNNDTES